MQRCKAKTEKNRKGFTLIELLVVISIIGILATIVLIGLSESRERAYFARAQQEMRRIHESLLLYYERHGTFPDDVGRDTMPPGLDEFWSGGWPKGPYPGGSVYDWDHWVVDDGDGEERIYQITLRFCDVQGDNCAFPDKEWAEDFDSHSGLFWCMEGPCRSHNSRPIDHPGYCVNCSDHPAHHPSLSE